MSNLRALSTPLRRSLLTSAPLTQTRTLFTSRPTTPLRSKGALAGGAALALSLPFTLGFSSKAAAPNADAESKSSTVLRAKSPAAFRPQATTLMFASVRGELRYEWQEWIAYFREAGFDCIDVNLDYANRNGEKAQAQDIFADELGSQIRLSSLQRSPLLFAHLTKSTPGIIPILHSHVHSRPHIAGAILVSGKDTNTSEEERKSLDEISKKLGGRLLVVTDSQDGLRDGERWLIEKGF